MECELKIEISDENAAALAKSQSKMENSDDVSNDSGFSSVAGSAAPSMKEEETYKKEMESIEAQIAARNQREQEANQRRNAEKFKEFNAEETRKNLAMLLDRSAIYADLILARLRKEKEQKQKLDTKLSKKNSEQENKTKNEEQKESGLRRSSRVKRSPNKLDSPVQHEKPKNKRGKRKVQETLFEYFNENEMEMKKSKYKDEKTPDLKTVNVAGDVEGCDLTFFTGGTLRDYQMDGLMWLNAQYLQAINGILADEMGLGKTVQVIALLCHLYAKGVKGPFLIVAPLSTLPNWSSELKRFAPEIPFVVYHGQKDTRERLRRDIKRGSVLRNSAVMPIVLTSYEIIMYDRKYLAKLYWDYIVIDEGHRIKNSNCMLKRQLMQLPCASRLLLTGTPLQNNLAELWSLLNFLLPDVFTDLVWFEAFFDFTAVHETDGEKKIVAKEQEEKIISKLHSILTPFLLRRIKTDVEIMLPPKKEIWIYTPMSPLQIAMYKAALDKCMLKYFGKEPERDNENVEITTGKRRSVLRPETWHLFFEDDDDKKFNKKENEYHLSSVRSAMMMFRQICIHPYLLKYPLTEDGEYLIDEDFVLNSGKFAVLDRLLTGLVERKHKILLFSQMCMALDLVHDLCYLRNISFCRLDGSMSLEDRQEQMELFSNDPTVPVFLISTRAGGLGLNLTAADTVIILDSDWNPQGDLQAQDRCHRIGQTKPVVVYRLITRGTMEEKIVRRASAKRRLEKMVIRRGNFKFGQKNQLGFNEQELLDLLKSADFNQILETGTLDGNKVITDEQLERLLDRSNMTGENETTAANENKNGLFEIVADNENGENEIVF